MAGHHPAHACRWPTGTPRQELSLLLPNVLSRIAAHSWGHANMSSLNETEIQVQYLEMAFRNILGFFPTYFRPPYDGCRSETCQKALKGIRYHIGKCKSYKC
jgi:peptidoglycan/xylan/chitin deacetylase (PgdA/CDA1 family)